MDETKHRYIYRKNKTRDAPKKCLNVAIFMFLYIGTFDKTSYI